MPLHFNPPNVYAWTPGSPRPAKPPGFSENLAARFLDTTYARETTLADFIRAHPNALRYGVLNQLHRRHVISWDLIKRFTAKAAATDFNNDLAQLTQNIFLFFRVDPMQAIHSPHGAFRATHWENIANAMCWVESNVFVGPSAGNVGIAIDQGDELTDAERRDLLAGAAWRGAGFVEGQMQGFVNA